MLQGACDACSIKDRAWLTQQTVGEDSFDQLSESHMMVLLQQAVKQAYYMLEKPGLPGLEGLHESQGLLGALSSWHFALSPGC